MYIYKFQYSMYSMCTHMKYIYSFLFFQIICTYTDIFQPVNIVYYTSPGTITLSWVHYNNCTIVNCTTTFETIWKKKDESTSVKADTTETSYTITNLDDGTYDVALTAFCKENPSIRNDTLHVVSIELTTRQDKTTAGKLV